MTASQIADELGAVSRNAVIGKAHRLRLRLGLLGLVRLGGRGLVGLHRGRTRLEAEPVRLADHGVAADRAELVGDLARGHALRPQLLQPFDALVGPLHCFIPRLHGLQPLASVSSDSAMNDRPSDWVRTDPGVPVIRSVNWGGLKTLYLKEVRRFFKVQLQTIWAPAVTTMLFLVIFTVALGRTGRQVMGVPFADFLAPGLIVMGMIQAAFANSSFSLLVGKIQGTIVDYLMPPLSTGELIAGMIGASVTRAVLVGLAVWLAMILWPGVHVVPRHPLAIVWFGLMGSMMLSFLGLLTSIWADKFDHAAAVSNFVVAPLSLLSGTFYSIESLSPVFRAISHANPFFYVISGFRYGFLQVADSPVTFGAALLLAINIALGALCYWLLRTGWKLKS
jgi:ABC-2 type transport system permease protein